MTRSNCARLFALTGLCIGFAATSAQAQTVFSYPNFSSTTGLAFNGAAVPTNPFISITPPVRASAGSVWYRDRVPVSGIWFSNFRFRVTDLAGVGADGFAFVIHNSIDQTAALGSPGGALGYAGNPIFPIRSGIDNCLAVEFDLWNNSPSWNDFDAAQHVSVQCRGLLANSPDGQYSMGSTTTLPNLSDGLEHSAQIQYLGGVLNVYVDFTQVLSTNVNLSTELLLASGQAFVGFTGSTGGFDNVERHELLAWDFNVVPGPSAAVALAVTGIGFLGLRPTRARR